MCIILQHPPGAKLPAEETLIDCWLSNPDGAGIMWRNGGKVEIIKGLMDYNNFIEVYEELNFNEDMEFALHFRISTSGGVSAPNCHPFPITPIAKELKLLRGSFLHTMMHNGVLGKGDEKRKLSDTMLFVIHTLSLPFITNNINNEIIQEYLNLKTQGSRLLIYTPKLTIRTGLWYSYEECHFSNRSYEPWDRYATSKKPIVIGDIDKIDDGYYWDFKEEEVICPECGSTQIEYSDEFTDGKFDAVFQCMTCYTLLDEDGFRWFPTEKNKKGKRGKSIK